MERPTSQENIRFPPLGGSGRPQLRQEGLTQTPRSSCTGGGRKGPWEHRGRSPGRKRPHQKPKPVPHAQAGSGELAVRPESQAAPGSTRPHVGLGGGDAEHLCWGALPWPPGSHVHFLMRGDRGEPRESPSAPAPVALRGDTSRDGGPADP